MSIRDDHRVPHPVRDTLLIALTFTAGCVDAISYLGLGRVFTANMTGNAVLLGVALGHAEASTAERSAVAVVGFALGALAGSRIAPTGPRGPAWPRHVTVALAIELVALVAFAAFWPSSGTPLARLADALTGLSALAMGIQSAAARRLAVSGVTTTYVTGTLTSLMAGLAALATPNGWARQAAVLGALLVGAVVGGLAEVHSPRLAAFIPMIVVAAVVAVAAAGHLRPRSSSW
jgi:uncharacterized membrane protein YoaK (UPF0700 family)